MKSFLANLCQESVLAIGRHRPVIEQKYSLRS
jgi:hypothetical protein